MQIVAVEDVAGREFAPQLIGQRPSQGPLVGQVGPVARQAQPTPIDQDAAIGG
jgi:hypothetical protein